MYVKQPAHGRCSNAVGSLILSAGKNIIKEGGLWRSRSPREVLLRSRDVLGLSGTLKRPSAFCPGAGSPSPARLPAAP